MESSPGLNELRDSGREWSKFYQRLGRKHLSRRKVVKLGALASMLGISGALQAIIAACGGEEEAGPSATGTPTGAGTGTPVSSAGITGDWDTTGTPPYKQGLPDDVARIPEGWKQYPWVYKYGPWRYNWDIPVTRGGHIIDPFGPTADYDLMRGNIYAQASYSKLYQHGMRQWPDPTTLFTIALDPDLVKEEEHSPDYTSWTFKIHEGVKFHNIPPVNGRELTAEDVAFSFNTHREMNVFKTALRLVDRVTAVDKYTVRFDLKQPYLAFRETLMLPFFMVFAEEHFEDQDLFKRQPIGTGAWVTEFSEFQNKADLVAHKEYFRKPFWMSEKYRNERLPFADKFTRQYIGWPPSDAQMKAAFINGQIDSFATSCYLDPAFVKELLATNPDSVVMTNSAWMCCPIGVAMNYKNPIFQDIRVRRALSMAIDRERIVKDVLSGSGIIGGFPTPLDLMGYDFPPPLSEYGPYWQHNPQQAKQLLADAGYPNGLSLKFYTSQVSGVVNSVEEAVLFMLKSAGIEVEKVLRDGQLLTQDRLNRSYPDLIAQGGTTGYSVDSTIGPVLRSDSPLNSGGVNDPMLDELIDKQASAANPDDAIKLARDIRDYVTDQVSQIWVVWPGGVELFQPWIHGKIISAYTCLTHIGSGNFSTIWIDERAPGGRGGRPI